MILKPLISKMLHLLGGGRVQGKESADHYPLVSMLALHTSPPVVSECLPSSAVEDDQLLYSESLRRAVCGSPRLHFPLGQGPPSAVTRAGVQGRIPLPVESMIPW